jgi:hypothetical protein
MDDEKLGDKLMEGIVFGEKQSFACVTSIPLSERVAPTFHVFGQPGFFAN